MILVSTPLQDNLQRKKTWSHILFKLELMMIYFSPFKTFTILFLYKYKNKKFRSDVHVSTHKLEINQRKNVTFNLQAQIKPETQDTLSNDTKRMPIDCSSAGRHKDCHTRSDQWSI